MAWVKLDDKVRSHPKVLAAGREAFGFWCASLTYAADYETDGRIPGAALAGIFPGTPPARARRLAARLVDAGLWEADGDGWRIHDFLDYNPSADERAAERTATATRVQAWREKRRSNAVTPQQAPRDGNAVTPPPCNAVGNTAPVPVPVPLSDSEPPLLTSFAEPPLGGGRPNGTGVDPKPKRTRRIRARLPDEWAPSNEAVAQAKALGFSEPELEAITDEFCTHWWGEGKPKADWDMTWLNRIIALKQGGRRR